MGGGYTEHVCEVVGGVDDQNETWNMYIYIYYCEPMHYMHGIDLEQSTWVEPQ